MGVNWRDENGNLRNTGRKSFVEGVERLVARNGLDRERADETIAAHDARWAKAASEPCPDWLQKWKDENDRIKAQSQAEIAAWFRQEGRITLGPKPANPRTDGAPSRPPHHAK